MPIAVTPEGVTLQFADRNVSVREDTEMGVLLKHVFDVFHQASLKDRHLSGGSIQFNPDLTDDQRWRSQALVIQRYARDLAEMLENAHFLPSHFSVPVRCNVIDGQRVLTVTRTWKTAQRNGSLLKNERQYFFHFTHKEKST